MQPDSNKPRGFDTLQKISVSIMTVLVLLTFIGANLHAVLWQSSSWLVSTVLPAVVVQLTNEERADLDESPLRRSTTLDAAAKLKAEHMAKNEYFAHYSPDGVSPWHWFNESGYVFAHAGENLAIHFTDSSEVVEAWMDSPTHRANIVNGDYTEIGVGTAKGKFDGYDTVYVVQLFGTPAIPPTPAPAASPVATVIEESVTTPVTPESPLEDAVAGIDADLAVVSSTEATTVTTTVATITPPVIVNDRPVMASSKYRIEEVGSEIVTVTDDSVIIESTIATSSGLAVANIVTDSSHQAGTTAIAMATQPNELLQMVYIVLSSIVVTLLLSSAVFEMRRFHYLQVAYSFLLVAVMGGLFFVHSLLTGGAVIV